MSTWPPCAMLYDGSFAGFLTCVGESFRQKVYPFYFLSPGVEQISLYPILETPTDQALAKSVYRSLEETVSSTFRRLITYSFLTCLPQRERTMFDLIYLAFHQALPQDLTDDRVLLLTRAIQHLTHEAHQLKGFVRFADYGGVLVGQIARRTGCSPCSALTSASGCRKKPFSSTTKPTGKASSTPTASGKSVPWTIWTWTDRTRPNCNVRLSGGGSIRPSPFPPATTPSAACPTCPSVTGTTCRRCSPTPCPPPNSPSPACFLLFICHSFPEIPPPHLDPGQGA